MSNKKKEKCLNIECVALAQNRGVCLACYLCATRLVRQNKTTWEKLEAAGKVIKKENRDRVKWFLNEETK